MSFNPDEPEHICDDDCRRTCEHCREPICLLEEDTDRVEIEGIWFCCEKHAEPTQAQGDGTA